MDIHAMLRELEVWVRSGDGSAKSCSYASKRDFQTSFLGYVCKFRERDWAIFFCYFPIGSALIVDDLLAEYSVAN